MDAAFAGVSGGAGTALSLANWTETLKDSLRDKSLMINGVASPLATQALAGLGVNLVTKVLPGPLQ